MHGHDRAGAPVEIDARFVVGADGLDSRVARAVGAEVVERRGDGGAVQYAYYAGLPWQGIEFFVAERSLAGVFPTHDGEACIWVACTVGRRAGRPPRVPAPGPQAFLAQLSDRGSGARGAAARRTPHLAGDRACCACRTTCAEAHGPGWALVGDAGYHRDAVTGHGISDAFRDAELLAVASTARCAARPTRHTALAELPAASATERCARSSS